MRISGTEPSSVILSQTKKFKTLKSDAPKMPKQAEAKRDGVINPQNDNFNQTTASDLFPFLFVSPKKDLRFKSSFCVYKIFDF